MKDRKKKNNKIRWLLLTEYPAGTWRLYNIASKSIDVEPKLYKRHVPAGYVLGKEWWKYAAYLTYANTFDRNPLSGICLVHYSLTAEWKTTKTILELYFFDRSGWNPTQKWYFASTNMQRRNNVISSVAVTLRLCVLSEMHLRTWSAVYFRCGFFFWLYYFFPILVWKPLRGQLQTMLTHIRRRSLGLSSGYTVFAIKYSKNKT